MGRTNQIITAISSQPATYSASITMATEGRDFLVGALEVYITQQAGVRSDLLKHISSVGHTGWTGAGELEHAYSQPNPPSQ